MNFPMQVGLEMALTKFYQNKLKNQAQNLIFR